MPPAGPTSLLRDASVVAAAVGLVGITYGAVATSAGLPWWATVLTSVIVFAGAAQFLFVALLAAGAGPLAAVGAALVVNARLLPLAFAARPWLPGGPVGRLLASHLVTDETVAFARAEGGRPAFVLLGPTLFGCWNVGGVIGIVAASRVADTDALGLDAAFPAALLALVLPSLRSRTTALCALAGSALAVAATPVLPAGLPVILALLVVLPVAWRSSGRRGER